MKIFQSFRCCALIALLTMASAQANAAELFVNKQGNDAHAGTSRDAAFLTVQKGVAALQPGDTLSIGPGEYTESIERKNLGSADKETVIRAEISGTVLLRGDVPAPKFRAVPGKQFVYVADFDFKGEVPVVNEIDTLSILNRMPNSTELEFIPGTFFHDIAGGKLYVSTSDMKPIETHRYSVAINPNNGIYLVGAKRVVIEGITVTGFSSMKVIHYTMGTAGSVWGMFLLSGHQCTIRDCRAYLNGWGIGMNSGEPGSGENVVERCTAWGNNSAFAFGDMGGISIFGARRDTIRDSTAFLNGMYGINIYGTGGAPPGADDGGNVPEKMSRLTNNLAWGNQTADFKIKTGYEYFHVVENCTTRGNVHSTNLLRSIVGRSAHVEHPSTDYIILEKETELEPRNEFADPDNYDYRLQATSRFRKTGPKGVDRGPVQYAENIFYVKPTGDDGADGLSIGKAWKTIARAVKTLEPGDTLYLEPGTYAGGFELQASGSAKAPIIVRGRGTGAAVVEGAVRIKGASSLQFARVRFADQVQLENGSAIGFQQCVFSAKNTAIQAANVRALTVSHCTFTGFQQAALDLARCSGVQLSGNLYDNAQSPAIKLAGADSVAYSNYNSYAGAAAAWEVDGAKRSLTDLHKSYDQKSQELAPQFAMVDGVAALKNPELFTAGGPLGKAIGPYRDEAYRRELQLVNKPKLHSVSATTANLEWTTSLPATCEFAWGETPACEKKGLYDVNCFGTYSFTGLTPGRKYYFRMKKLSIPTEMVAKYDAQPVALADDLLEFTTAAQDAPPATYYVAGDGDDARTGLSREQAWKTIRRASEKVNVGDTVMIAGGKYSERVRMRATGAKGAPITFRSIPGERVELDGAQQALNNAFVVGRKSYLRFDGFYLANFNMFPDSRWPLGKGAEFHLYEGSDIEISRCLSDGRGGYSAESVDAYFTENLTITNCVNTNKMGGAIYIYRCPNFVARNNVFAAPMIFAMVLRNTKTQPSTMDNNIFTDMFDKKARLNLGLLCVDGEIEAFRQHNNCYLLRDIFPLSERALVRDFPVAKLGKHIIDPLFADPLFAGDPGPAPNAKVKPGFAPDRLMDAAVKVDFNTFFATNPELLKRDIGLQPDAFKEFRFQVSTPVKTQAKAK
ncbi:MAG: right-handed parallel beta-helix repeat-containing protein [Planctomycetia bacterium]|nr:right-handed parallel beta-helix repeat-containing protein [Planctomycetia bacterium]